MIKTITGVDELVATIGVPIGPSEWRTVARELVESFAAVSGDDQWIHIDVERSKIESPYKTTIAHGDLTLSLIAGIANDLFVVEGFQLGVNYGWNKVRFPAPVPVGSRIRATAVTVSVDDVGDGWYHWIQRWTVEVEGQEKPACVAEAVARLLV